MDAALAPLRFQGIRVLNYLDDWLILAHSRELVSRHRDIVLRHIHSLGLRMNAKKSVLFPSQRTVFSGVHLDSVQMQARLAPARISNFTACLARFKLGHHVSVSTCRRLLGLMAAASPVLPLGLLHVRPFFWWIKELRLYPTIPATRLIRVSHSCSRPLLQWRDPAFLQSGVRMGAIHHRHMITTDASMTGWGAVFKGSRVPFLAHKLPGTQGCLPGFHTFSPHSWGPSYNSQNGQSMAECKSVRVSASKADSGSPMQSKGERCPSPSHSPILALPDLVLGAKSPPVSAPFGDSDQTGPAVLASGQNLASSTRALEVVGMAHTGPRALIINLPVEVQETIASARAPATRKLYSSKWGVFESWCLARAIDPVNCPVGLVLEFLQERLTSGAAATTLRVYVAAIAARRELDEVPLGRHRMVSHRGAFLRLLVFGCILLGA